MNFDYILLPHSLDLGPDKVMVEAKSKIDGYIKYRYDRLVEMLNSFGNGT